MIDKNLVAAPGSPDRALLDALDLTRLPRHVAVIMDGNGRWAKQRHLPRVEGHRAGAAAVRDTVETAARLGLDALTLYAFSTENWKRPQDRGLDPLHAPQGVPPPRAPDPGRERHPLPRRGTARRARRVRPVRARHGARGHGRLPGHGLQRRPELLGPGRDHRRRPDASRARPPRAASTRSRSTRRPWPGGSTRPDLPDPDLLIRTSGEMRISNFLLWQIAYAEIHVTPVLWPDFRCRHFLEALVDYQRRERRYGGVSERRDAARGRPRLRRPSKREANPRADGGGPHAARPRPPRLGSALGLGAPRRPRVRRGALGVPGRSSAPRGGSRRAP